MLMNCFFSFSKSTEYNILFVTKLYDIFRQIFNDVIGSFTVSTLGEANICGGVLTSVWISICMHGRSWVFSKGVQTRPGVQGAA